MNSSKPRALVRALLTYLVLVLIGLAGTELLGRAVFDNPFPYWNYRFRFTTPDAFRNFGTIWTYRPNADTEELTVYKHPFGRFFIESDCHYRSDTLGFLDNPAPLRHYDILLLGDSFTAGEAGCSWMQELRAQLPGLSIYNAGLLGTGVENWATTERYLTEQGLTFSHVMVLFIGDDFFRGLANWKEPELACVRDIGQCTAVRPYYPLLPHMDVLEVAAERAHHRGFADELIHFWKRHLWVSAFLISRIGDIIGGRKPVMTRATTDAFQRIEAASPDLQLVRITQKDEVALRADNGTSIVADRYLRSRALPYDRCTLSYDDFFAYDPHPNARGYAHLASCVAAIARRWQPAGVTATTGGQ